MKKFEKAYILVKDDLTCPKGCRICEEGALQFLPGEVEFISRITKIAKNKLAKPNNIKGYIVWSKSKEDKHCLFYKFGRCIKRNARPLDCRTYPIIPYLKDGKISVKLDDKCPLVKQGKVNKGFIKGALEAWRIADPPRWWIKIYEKEM